MADVIRVDYESLQKVADQFGQHSDVVAQVVQAVRGALDPLEGGGWIGRGSDAFFTEMDNDILPAAQRLIDALAQACDVSNQIMNLMQEADEEACSGFKGDAGMGASGRIAGAGGNSPAGGIGAALGQTLQTGGAGGGAGGAWGSGGFNPGGAVGGGLDGLIANNGFGSLGGGGFDGGLFGGGGSGSGFGSGGSGFGSPGSWLSGVGDSLNGFMGDNFNDYGIPRDWLSGVTGAGGGGSYNDYGIPQDWLSGVTDSLGGDTAASADSVPAASGGGSSGGAGSAGGGSSGGSEPTPSTSGGGSGGGSSQSDISDPFSQGGVPRDFRGTGGASASSAPAASQSGGLRYQSLAGLSSGGGAGAAAASVGAPAASSGGGLAAPAAAAGGQSNAGIAFGIAAASPFLALLGKAIKGQMDDD